MTKCLYFKTKLTLCTWLSLDTCTHETIYCFLVFCAEKLPIHYIKSFTVEKLLAILLFYFTTIEVSSIKKRNIADKIALNKNLDHPLEQCFF